MCCLATLLLVCVCVCVCVHVYVYVCMQDVHYAHGVQYWCNYTENGVYNSIQINLLKSE